MSAKRKFLKYAKGYVYFRLPSGKLIPLPTDETSVEFERAYQACLAQRDAAPRPWPREPNMPNSVADEELKQARGVVLKLRRKRGALSQLAVALGVTAQAVHQWEVVPIDRVLDVERITGISRQKLRPDYFATSASKTAADKAEVTLGKPQAMPRLEQVQEYLPTAQQAFIDASVNRCIVDGVYLVRLHKGDRSQVLGRLVWPKI